MGSRLGRGAGALTQRPPHRGCSSRLPHSPPRPTGRPLKPGGGFDLGSTPLSWPSQMRWGEGLGNRPPRPRLPCTLPATPPPHTQTVSGCCGGSRPSPPPRLAAVPQLRGPTLKTAGREAGDWGRGAGRSCWARAGTRGGQRHERTRAARVAGGRKPPGGRLPGGCAHLGHSSRPPSVGWGRGPPDTQPFPERGGVTASQGRQEGSAWGVRAAISALRGMRHRVWLWVPGGVGVCTPGPPSHLLWQALCLGATPALSRPPLPLTLWGGG